MRPALLVLILAGVAFTLKEFPRPQSDVEVHRVQRLYSETMYAFAVPIFLLIIGVPAHFRQRATAQLNAEEKARAAEVWSSKGWQLGVTFGSALVCLLLINWFPGNHRITLIFIILTMGFVTADEFDRLRRAKALRLPESYLHCVRRWSLLYLLIGFIAWGGLTYYY